MLRQVRGHASDPRVHGGGPALVSWLGRSLARSLAHSLSCVSSDNLRLAGPAPGSAELGTSSTDELLHLASECGLPWEAIREVLLNGVRFGFLPEAEKAAALGAFARKLDEAMRAEGLL